MAVYLVNEKNSLVGEAVTLSILSAFIQSASKLINSHSSAGFPELISIMNTLSCAGSGLGHLYLFQVKFLIKLYTIYMHLYKQQQKLQNGSEYCITFFVFLNVLKLSSYLKSRDFNGN